MFVRSPFAHALITGVDASEAVKAPGVLAVYTSADLGPAPCRRSPTSTKSARALPLAKEQVRFVGDMVAVVAAESRAPAVDAAELVVVDYERCPAVVDLEAAVGRGAPLQFEAVGSNVAAGGRDTDATRPAGRCRRGRPGPDRKPADGGRPRWRATPSRSSPATTGDTTLTVLRRDPDAPPGRNQAVEIFGLDPTQVRVVAPHVGGAFGGKAGVAPSTPWPWPWPSASGGR